MCSQVFVLVFAALLWQSLAAQNSTRKTVSYIIDGQRSDITEFPYLVSIYQGTLQPRFICGGSLINSEWVVTAGHCVDPRLSPSLYQLRLGSSLLGRGGVLRRGLNIIRHKGFSYGENFLANDVALIKIASVDFSDAIRPATLPGQDQGFSKEAKAFIAGFGKQQNDKKAPSSRFLMKAKVPSIANEKCRKLMLKRWHLLLETSSQVCFGDLNGGSSTCMGDSGGPLVLDGVLVGLTSWGITDRCGMPDSPAVFARLSYYRDWISQNSGV